jgi:hypothetical protein
MAARVGMGRRLSVLALLLVLYLLAVLLGAVSLPGYRNASGVRDLGHFYIPSLLSLLGRHRAEYVWWLGTVPLELFFGVIALAILFTGRGIRLGLCLYIMYVLHWLFMHATTLPVPDDIVSKFPEGVFTLSKPEASDFWFSGHVANAVVIALAARESRLWIRVVAWGLVPFEILLVLSTRVHYTIDVIGAIFVAYTVHRVSLDIETSLNRSRAAGSS